jgi:glyoxylase-like metal-dependent hydrolase (beta-lactamase superfamily II)
MNNRSKLSRREVLSLMGLTSAALVVRPTSAAAAPSGTQDASLIYRFKIGDFSAVAVNDGFRKLDSPQTFYAPKEPTKDFDALLKDWYVVTSRVFLPYNVLLVDTGKERVIIDSGSGGTVAPNLGKALSGLEAAGYHPEDVSVVFLSHGHPDHIGGLVTPDNKPAYPNAKHFVLKTEFDFWTGEPDLSAQLVPDGQKVFLISFAQERFAVLKDKFALIEDGTEFTPGFKAILAPGHTPGHSMVDIQSGRDRLLHMVDLGHHYVVPFQRPFWKPAPDANPVVASVTRKKIFTQVAQDRTRVFGYHMPFPAVGHIRTLGPGFEWLPEPWTPV